MTLRNNPSQSPDTYRWQAGDIDTHTCVRCEGKDRYIIRLRPEARPTIAVSPYFEDGDEVVELYTGCRTTVVNGCVTFPVYENHIAIVTRAQ